jgi:hypothetical protein
VEEGDRPIDGNSIQLEKVSEEVASLHLSFLPSLLTRLKPPRLKVACHLFFLSHVLQIDELASKIEDEIVFACCEHCIIVVVVIKTEQLTARLMHPLLLYKL